MVRSLRSPAHLTLTTALTDFRKASGMTQSILAKSLNRPQSYVAKVETGERRLDVVEFLEWCEAIGCDPTAVLEQVRGALTANQDC